MEQLLIVIQGLAYSALVVTLLANRLGRSRGGKAPILVAAVALAVLHGLLTILVPAAWIPTWLVFWVPGHILTPLVLLWMQRGADE